MVHPFPLCTKSGWPIGHFIATAVCSVDSNHKSEEVGGHFNRLIQHAFVEFYKIQSDLVFVMLQSTREMLST